MKHRLHDTAFMHTRSRKRRLGHDLADSDAEVRHALADSDPEVRYAAVVTIGKLGKLDRVALTQHAGTIVNLLTDSDAKVRSEASVVLNRIDTMALTPHIGAILRVFAGCDRDVLFGTFKVLNKFKAALTPHTDAIADMLSHSDHFVRRFAIESLNELDEAALTPHAGAIAGAIADMIAEILLYDMYSMRSSAMEVLMKLEATALTPHLDAIIGLFTNLRTGVANERIRDMAKIALPKLKQMRARLNWVTARMYRVRWYGLCWYADVLVKLCAQGGKWAERDRAAFHAEFI